MRVFILIACDLANLNLAWKFLDILLQATSVTKQSSSKGTVISRNSIVFGTLDFAWYSDVLQKSFLRELYRSHSFYSYLGTWGEGGS